MMKWVGIIVAVSSFLVLCVAPPLGIFGLLLGLLVFAIAAYSENQAIQERRHREMLAATRGESVPSGESYTSRPYNPYYQRPAQSKTDISKLGDFDPPSA